METILQNLEKNLHHDEWRTYDMIFIITIMMTGASWCLVPEIEIFKDHLNTFHWVEHRSGKLVIISANLCQTKWSKKDAGLHFDVEVVRHATYSLLDFERSSCTNVFELHFHKLWKNIMGIHLLCVLD